MNFKKIMAVILAMFLVVTLFACGSSDEKKMKFFNKGMELYESGELVKARLEFKNALQIDRKFPDAFLMLGKLDLVDGNYRGAFGKFSKAADLEPDLLDAHLEIAKLYLMGKALDKVKEKVDLVLEKDPQNITGLLLKASIYLAENNHDQANILLAGLLERGVKKPEVYTLLARSRPFTEESQADDMAAAEKILKEGIQENPEHAGLYIMLAGLYGKNQRFDDAAGVLRQIIKLKPDQLSFKISLAGLYWGQDKKEKSFEVMKEFIGIDPADEKTRLSFAKFLAGKKDMEKAESLLREGIQVNEKSFQLRFAVSDLLLARQDIDGAVAILEECLSLESDAGHPGVLEAKSRLAKIFLALGEFDKAKKYVGEVLLENPKSIDAHLVKGTIYLRRGHGEKAVAEFRTVVQERPQFEAGYIQLAEAHVLSSEVELAIDTLRQGIKNNPTSKTLLKALAQRYFAQKKYAEAEAHLRKIIEFDPDDLKIYKDLGDLLMTQGDFDRAKSEYLILKEKSNQAPVAFLSLSNMYGKQGKSDKALAELETGFAKNDKSLLILSQIVQLHTKQGDFAKAEKMCKAAIKKFDDPAAYNLLGKVFMLQKEFDQAEASFQKAIDLNPSWSRPYENQAQLYVMQGQRRKAIERFKSIIKKQPDALEASLSLALLYEMGKEYTMAMEVYEDVLTRRPGFWTAANNLAYLMSEKGNGESDLRRAMKLVQRAQASQGERAEISDTLGWIHFKIGDFERAAIFLEKAVADTVPTPVVKYHLGMLRLKQERTLEAKQLLEEALAGDRYFLGRDKAEAALSSI